MDLTGQTLDRYQIIELIGEGGMAAVYKAYQEGLDRYVAVKVLPTKHTQPADFKERFVREARAIAQLSHPNILPIYDVNQTDNFSYFVMKYVPGQTLWHLMTEPLPLPQVSRYVAQIAGALDHAHRRGVLHRDIKPSNILLDEDEDWLYLADFGLAKLLEGTEALTVTGQFMGTPAYISPEQAQGQPVDPRTDIYSLGVVLYQMITGRLPFEGELPVELIFKQVHEPAPSLRQFKPDLPALVDQVILKTLAKDPAYRFDQAGEFAEALRHAIASQSDIHTPATSPKTKPVFDDPSQQTSGLPIVEDHGTPQTSRPTNPYTTRAVIKDPATFVGRTNVLYDLYTLLAGMQSCSIVGPRRIGKSSLLFHLTHPSVYANHVPDSNSYVFAYLDLQELAGLGPDDFCSTVVERLSRASSGQIEIDLDRDGTYAGIRRFLMRVTDAGLRLVLCLDEFEMLSQNPNFGTDFFTYLRGLCSNYNLALVTSSRSSLFDLCHLGNLETSQFWNIFTERMLGLMPDDEARTLISDPFTRTERTISDAHVDFILKLAGRHPFFIQIACYHLYAPQLTGDATDLKEIERQYFDEAHRHFTYAWEQLDEQEQGILAALAQATSTALEPTLFQRLARSVLVTGTADSPSLISESWRRFILSQVENKPPDSSSSGGPIEPASDSSGASRKARSYYADFEIKVEQIDPTSCRVEVLDSPAGQDSVICKLPFNLNKIGQVMVNLGQRIARGMAEQTSGQMTPTTTGEALFQSVFSGPVSQLFFESLGRVHSQGQGLRIKIHLDPEQSPQLAALPWEFLYNDRRRSFLSLSRSTPIIRYLDVQAPTDQLRINLPLRVLVVIASPEGLPALNLPREQELIKQAWGNKPEVAVEFLDPATPGALQARLWDWQPHVLHFMGHGQFDRITGSGTLIFIDHNNEPKPVAGAQLGGLLSNVPSVKLAFLNACQSAELSRHEDIDPFSGVATALVMAGLPAVVAMQFPISDEAALAFASGFYPRLAVGDSVELAVSFGREAIRLEIDHSEEWGTPVLFMRTSEGHLFEIETVK